MFQTCCFVSATHSSSKSSRIKPISPSLSQSCGPASSTCTLQTAIRGPQFRSQQWSRSVLRSFSPRFGFDKGYCASIGHDTSYNKSTAGNNFEFPVISGDASIRNDFRKNLLKVSFLRFSRDQLGKIIHEKFACTVGLAHKSLGRVVFCEPTPLQLWTHLVLFQICTLKSYHSLCLSKDIDKTRLKTYHHLPYVFYRTSTMLVMMLAAWHIVARRFTETLTMKNTHTCLTRPILPLPSCTTSTKMEGMTMFLLETLTSTSYTGWV